MVGGYSINRLSSSLHYRWISSLFYARQMRLHSFDKRECFELRTAFDFAEIAFVRISFRKVRKVILYGRRPLRCHRRYLEVQTYEVIDLNCLFVKICYSAYAVSVAGVG